MVIVYTEFTLAQSLKLELRLLALDNRGDDDTLVVDIGRYLALRKEVFVTRLDRCLSHQTQRGRRHRRGLNARDQAEARRDSINFTGDAPLGPPFGWCSFGVGPIPISLGSMSHVRSGNGVMSCGTSVGGTDWETFFGGSGRRRRTWLARLR